MAPYVPVQSTTSPGRDPHPKPSEARRRVSMCSLWSFGVRDGFAVMVTTSPYFSVVLRHTLTRQLTAPAPLDRPPYDLSGLVRGFDLEEGVGVAELKLHHRAFDRNLLGGVVLGGLRVVCVGRHPGQERHAEAQKQHFTCHEMRPPRNPLSELRVTVESGTPRR